MIPFARFLPSRLQFNKVSLRCEFKFFRQNYICTSCRDLSELPCLLHRFVLKFFLDYSCLLVAVHLLRVHSKSTLWNTCNKVQYYEFACVKLASRYKKPNGRLGIRTTDLSTVNETIDSLRSAPCDCEQEVLFRWLQGHIEANTSRCTWKGNQLLLSLTING